MPLTGCELGPQFKSKYSWRGGGGAPVPKPATKPAVSYGSKHY